jgi:hypothetical protein
MQIEIEKRERENISWDDVTWGDVVDVVLASGGRHTLLRMRGGFVDLHNPQNTWSLNLTNYITGATVERIYRIEKIVLKEK